MARVVLTQPRPRIERLAKRLSARGHEVLQCPLRRLVALESRPEARAALGSVAKRDWVIFVSPGSIDACAEQLPRPWPASVGVAVIGPGSEQTLADHAIAPGPGRLVRPASAPFDAQSLLRTPPFDAPAGLDILVLAGETGRTDWIDELARRGAKVERVAIYRSEPVAVAGEVLGTLGGWAREPAVAVFVFTTTDAVRELGRALSDAGLGRWAHAQTALAPHPRIVALLREQGWTAARLVDPGEQPMLAAIESG